MQQVERVYGYGKGSRMVTMEPEILSRRDGDYFRQYSSHLSVGDVDALCGILMNPDEKIFTSENLENINHYGEVEVEGNVFHITGHTAADILLLVHKRRYSRHEVLHDTAMLASPEIRKEAIELLDKEEYLQILERKESLGSG